MQEVGAQLAALQDTHKALMAKHKEAEVRWVTVREGRL